MMNADTVLARLRFRVRGTAHRLPGHALRDDEDAVEVIRRPRMSPPSLPSDVAVGDLDDLLEAVKAKLRLSVDIQLAKPLEMRVLGPTDSVQTHVLECVDALDQLHLTLRHELARRQQLERELFEAQSELAQARAQLLGTQAGERRARHLALHDGLTTLPNRSCFRERLAQALTDADPNRHAIAVMYIDLDGFKSVNDAHGHDAGDELLKIVAARLKRSIRAEDTVSRLGGDEFACLLGGMPSREHLGALARKLFVAVSAPFKIGAVKLSVRPSIGIAIQPIDGATAESLLKHADEAMYRAKREQSGYSFFDPTPEH
jgi:diguanylate cyclase